MKTTITIKKSLATIKYETQRPSESIPLKGYTHEEAVYAALSALPTLYRRTPVKLICRPYKTNERLSKLLLEFKSVKRVQPKRKVKQFMNPDVEIWTDGCAKKGKGGIGYVISTNERDLLRSYYIGKATNNVAELTAIHRALQELDDRSKKVLIYCDSSYAIGVLSGSIDYTKNKELIREIRNYMQYFKQLQFKKVRAHSGVHGNELADRLAGEAV